MKLRFTAILGLSLFLIDSSHSQTKFNETTTGRLEESTDQFGGISESEQAYLDQAEQKVLQRFRDGRKSSAYDVSSRYAGLEFHDEDGDGVSDHGFTANDMEGSMDMVAIGAKGLSGKERADKLAEAKDKAGTYCVPHPTLKDAQGKPRYIQRGSNTQQNTSGISCDNKSAILVDMGASHGKDDEGGHRVYEITKEAFQEASKSGTDYFLNMKQSAANYDAQKYGMGVVQNVGGDPSKVRAKIGGKSFDANVASDIDLLRSEAAWLEEQKLNAIDKHWKSMRATRLAGVTGAVTSGTNVDGGLASMLWANASDDEISENIALRSIAGSSVYVDKDNGNTPIDGTARTNKLNACLGQNPNAAKTTQCNNKFPSVNDFIDDPNNPDGQLKRSLFQTAVQTVKSSNDPLTQQVVKDSLQQKAEISDCMKAENWCTSLSKAKAMAIQSLPDADKTDPQKVNQKIAQMVDGFDPKNPNAKSVFKLKPGVDVGAAFDDTREYNLSRLSIASKGPLSKFEETMRSMDLSEQTDAKTGSKQWGGLKKQIDYARGSWDKTRKREQQMANGTYTYTRNDGKVVTLQSDDARGEKYTGSNFDETKQNTYQLFMRQRGRDGSTFGMGRTPTQAAAPYANLNRGNGVRGRRPSNNTQTNTGATNTAPTGGGTAAPVSNGLDFN